MFIVRLEVACLVLRLGLFLVQDFRVVQVTAYPGTSSFIPQNAHKEPSIR